MARNNRNFSKKNDNGDESLHDKIRSLKSQIKKLMKENRELKSKNDTLEGAWRKTEDFLSEITDDVPLDELLKFRKLPKKAVRSVSKKGKAVDEDVDQKEDFRLKWKKWRQENL